MRRRRHRYISPAKKRFRKRLLVIGAICILVLAVLILLLPAITGGRVALLPFQKSSANSGQQTPKPEKSPFRWPWQKEETPSPTPSATPAGLESSPEGEEDTPSPSQSETPAAISTQPYPIQLDVNITDGARMQVVEQITYTNTTNSLQDGLLLHFPAAAMLEGGLTRLTYDGLANNAAYQMDSQQGLLTLALNEPLLPGQTLRITMAYTLVLPEGTGTLAYRPGDNAVIASDFYAYLAAYDPQTEQWFPDATQALTDITANITMPANYSLANSGKQVSRATLSTGNLRVLVEDMSSRHFGFATGTERLRNETVNLDNFTITNFATRSSTVVRVSELSGAVLQYYGETLGLPSADGDGINVMATELDRQTATWNNLILYNEDAFDDVNEFRYQYAVAVARLYFPEGAGIDANTEAFNTLLCHTLAARYVERSQTAELADLAYGHVAESKAFSQIIQNMPQGNFAQALQQYRMDALAGPFNIQVFYNGLSGSNAPSVESLLLEYRQRSEGASLS